MYNIIQLSNKELGELQDIANEMGIKGAKSLERQDLIYRILDEQAIVGAQKKVAAEEGKSERRQRTRINKKEIANKVYSADKDKAEKINDTPKIVTSPIEGNNTQASAPQNEDKQSATEATIQSEAKEEKSSQPKKQGRKSKTQKKEEVVSKGSANETEATKKNTPISAETTAEEQDNAEQKDTPKDSADTPSQPKKRGRKSKTQKKPEDANKAEEGQHE